MRRSKIVFRGRARPIHVPHSVMLVYACLALITWWHNFQGLFSLATPSWLHQSDHASILRQVEHINKCCVILECSDNQSLQLADLRRIRNQIVHENEMMQAIRRGILQAGVGVRYSTSWRLVGFRLLDMYMQRCDGCFTGQSTPSAAADVSMWLLIIMLLE